MINMDKLYPLMLDAFDNNMSFTFPVKGQSMRPFLKTNDVVTIKRSDNFKVGDVILYKRDNGQFVFHRIRRINKKNNTYILVGDHQRKVEKDIKYNQIIAKMISYRKQNKKEDNNLKGFRYKCYKLIVKSSIMRWLFSKLS
ncbi:MAG: S24/S26 family peptidase [Acholeplasmatales bacterium]|nr:S24/S26 family peptidase [Acholeplasmatales bacterium]